MRIFALLLSLTFVGCFTPDPVTDEEKLATKTPTKDSQYNTSPDFSDPSFSESDSYWQDKGQVKKDGATFPVIYFGYDQASLSEQSVEALNAVASQLQNDAGFDVQIEGHCDERGTTEYNLALGDRRANAVRDYLIDAGIAAHRLSTISYGEEQPADAEKTDTAFAMNRRAIIKVPTVSH